MNLISFRKILHARYVPYYAYPKTENALDILQNSIPSMTVKRKIKEGTRTKEHVFRVSSNMQKQIYTNLTSTTNYPPYIVGFSSVPNDLLALEAAGNIHYSMISKNLALKWKWWNINSNIFPSTSRDYNLVVIYNITKHSNLPKIREILNYFNRSLRIVVVAGMDAIDFFDNYLFHPLSGTIHFIGLGNRKINYVPTKKIKKEEIEQSKAVFSSDLMDILLKLKRE